MLPLNPNIKGKAAVVTGGGGILCGAFAEELARHGARVAVLDINRESAQRVVDRITASGGEAAAVGCNVLEKASLQTAVRAVQERFGEYHILINGAGGNNSRANTTNEEYCPDDVEDPAIQSFFDLQHEGFDFVFALNFMGTFLTTQAFARPMLGIKGATVINMSSMSAPCPMTKVPAYSAAKAAIGNFTQWLAVHFANTGLRVNAIAPGFFQTSQNRDLLFHLDGTLTERSDKILRHTPMRRFGAVEDLFGALLWLCDEEASGFVTGVTVPVDGGFMAYSGV